MGRTALHYAAREGHGSVVRELVSNCPELHGIPDYDGLMPLHMAARGGHVKVIECLRSHGSVNSRATNCVQLRQCFHRVFERGDFYSSEGRYKFSLHCTSLPDMGTKEL